MRPESPSQYLEKYKQEPIDAETQKRIDAMSAPWGETKYQDNGIVDVEHKNLHLRFEYAAVPHEVSSAFSERGLQEHDFFEVSNLTIQDVENDVERKMDEVLPPDFSVYFTLSEAGEETCYVVIEDKRIVLFGDPSSPRILLSLFHEIGHIYEQKNEKKFAPEEYQDRKSVDVTSIAKRVHSERDAWAFALKYLRPILTRTKDVDGAISADDALAFAKNVALHSYSEDAKDKVAQNRAMAHFAWDYMDDYEDEGENNDGV